MTDSDIPQYLYKYRSADSYSLDALFNSYAVFTGRKNFNDLFDSNIMLIKPTPKDIKQLRDSHRGKAFDHFSRFLKGTVFSKFGKDQIHIAKKRLESLIDEYLFYCVAEHDNNNLMWAHYANSHKGFCIEFNSRMLGSPSKVKYQKTIPEFRLTDAFDLTFSGEWRLETAFDNSDRTGQIIWDALRTKLVEWEYEKEYRVQPPERDIQHLPPPNETVPILRYDETFIASIIFGCRMPDADRVKIVQGMRYPVKYKKAVKETSTIGIYELTDEERIRYGVSTNLGTLG
ncbi:DUF2971 domain-containing protein [Deefgea rivuli]|uniref:DUF2971 domain-containing protein n=1 Tax=Deefgea rivuli TaxID=400948 RepID=UPI0004831143|nr:DUF2971 domain-containing protein [Deefgea rivuli]